MSPPFPVSIGSSLFVCRACLRHLRPSSTLAPLTKPPHKRSFRDIPPPPPFPRAGNDGLFSLPPEDVQSVHEYLAKLKDKATHNEQVKKTLLHQSRPLLRKIIAGEQKGQLPTLGVFLEQLWQSGILRNHHCYDALVSMMTKGAPVSEVLPVYEMAIKMHEKMIEREPASKIFLTPDHHGAVIYLAFFYLKLGKADSEVLDRVATDPGMQQSPRVYHLKTAMSKLPTELVTQLEAAIEEDELRRLLSNPQALRETLSKATARNNPDLVRNYYDRARALNPPGMNEQAYAIFIHAFLSSWRTQDTALEVFDDMQQDNVAPGHFAWEALLHYGVGRKDPDITLKIWEEMIDSGVIPDIYCWTTRISTQIKRGQYEAAVASLREMTDGGTIPTTASINAALTGLLEANQDQLINQVMAIAAEHKVPVDDFTYNTVLKTTLKHHGFRAALGVLKSMEANGVPPNIVTFSILLDGFSKSNINQAFDVLQSMEHYGIRPNVQNYTSLIGGLVERNNLEAVDVILDHMIGHKVQPNARTYTVLIKAAMAAGDIERIDTLWKEIDSHNIWRDHVLWAETIIGYAQLGEAQRVMDLISETKNPKWRVVLSLKAYTIILRALGRQNALMETRQIAEDLVNEWHEHREVKLWNGGKVETEFWETLESVGGPRWADALRQKAGEAFKSRKSAAPFRAPS